MTVKIKSIDDLINKLSKPAICNHAERNFDMIECELFESMHSIMSSDGKVILDRNCKITFLPINILEEFAVYMSLNNVIEETDDFIITDPVSERTRTLVEGAKFYLQSKKDYVKELSKSKKDELPSLVILEFEDGKRDILFGTPRYVKVFLGI